METTKQKVRRYYDEVWCKGNLAIVDELMAANYENCDPATPGMVLKGRDAFKGLVTMFRDAMPDLRLDIVEQYAEGDTVVSRWHASGTQRGALMGIPPTNKNAQGIEGVTITTFVEGRIVRDRAIWDLAGLLRLLGVLPS
ncbi:MAG TPA: ester cyclase [Polyangiaceae bacterium]|jgi:steroid delta-isomerase-like uncharacterized protein|nr:ester cyclase [Polyangiaceae bacterium]